VGGPVLYCAERERKTEGTIRPEHPEIERWKAVGGAVRGGGRVEKAQGEEKNSGRGKRSQKGSIGISGGTVSGRQAKGLKKRGRIVV